MIAFKKDCGDCMFFPCLPLNSAACESEKYLKNGLLSYKIKLKNKKRSAA
ncbi:hypothetical protein HMPREF3213_00195, partial [Heyndrickxia coagulans]